MFEFLKESRNTFEGRLPDEKTLIVLHEHWFSIANKLAVLGIIAIAPFVIYSFLSEALVTTNMALFYWLIATVVLMFVWMRVFYVLMKYLMNIWIITDHRIIDAELHGFFNRSISEINLAKIQDVTVHIKGFYQTYMNFGDIEVQSAGEKDKFVLHSIPDPTMAKNLIMRASNEFETFHPDKELVV